MSDRPILPFAFCCVCRSPDLIAACGMRCTRRGTGGALDDICPLIRPIRVAIRKERWRVRSSPQHSWKTDEELVDDFILNSLARLQTPLGAHPWAFLRRRVASWLTDEARGDAEGGAAPRRECGFCSNATKIPGKRGFIRCGVHAVEVPTKHRVSQGPACDGRPCPDFHYVPRGRQEDVAASDPTALDDLPGDRSGDDLDGLTSLQRDVFRRTHGLPPCAQPQSSEDIAADLGISKRRVEEILKTAEVVLQTERREASSRRTSTKKGSPSA